MTITMANDPLIGLRIKLGEVANGVDFDQAVNVIAFLQGHVSACTWRNFCQ